MRSEKKRNKANCSRSRFDLLSIILKDFWLERYFHIRGPRRDLGLRTPKGTTFLFHGSTAHVSTPALLYTIQGSLELHLFKFMKTAMGIVWASRCQNDGLQTSSDPSSFAFGGLIYLYSSTFFYRNCFIFKSVYYVCLA